MTSSLTSDPWIGRLIGDRQRYRLDKRLGAGGMGEVFLAMDTLLGKQVAVKLIKDTLSVAAEQLRKRFEREVALCAALKSDNIVAVSDYGVTPEGHPFYVMEYLCGQTLGKLLRQQQRLSVERTVGIITQVCEGLQVAHEGVTLWRDGAASEHVLVVHRDMKPENIFLVPTALGELVKILDFGIAKIRNDSSEHSNLTSMFIGTCHYAAPEQFDFAKDLDGRADIYSLGIILYEMLAGTDPFGLGFNLQEISAMSWLMAHISKPPVPLRSQPGLEQLEPELEAVVMRCLQKAPDKRFASVDELKRALQAAFSVRSAVSSTTNPHEQEITAIIHQQYPLNQRILNPSEKSTDSIETAETYELNPSLPIGEPQGGENKKKLQQLLLKSTVVAAVVSVCLALYTHIQGQAEQSTLNSIKILKEGKNFEECVNGAKEVPPKSHFYADAQNLLNECQLEQAKELAKNNNFKDASAEANKIELDSSFRQEAQQFISQWSENLLKQAEERYKQSYNSKDLQNAIDITKAIPKTSSVSKKAEEMIGRWRTEWNNNENSLKAAQNALNAGESSQAIAKASTVRILGQEVKENTPYWQTKIKPIIETAQKRIAASNSQKIRTNNAVKPKPRPLTVRSVASQGRVRFVAPAPRSRVRSVAIQGRVRSVAPRSRVRSVAPRSRVRSAAPRRGWTNKKIL